MNEGLASVGSYADRGINLRRFIASAGRGDLYAIPSVILAREQDAVFLFGRFDAQGDR